jgi:hypothetical protein
MRDDETHLDALPGPLLDLDVDRFARWIAVCGDDRGASHVVVDGITSALRFECRYPLLRILDPEHVLLVDCRCAPRAQNAWVLLADGRVERSFRVGDAVADVVVVDESIVVSYFDEALGASDGLSGVVVFGRDGEPGLRYADAFGHDLVDCYCACDAGRGRVLFLGHPTFDAVLLDTRTKTRTAWPTARVVHGASAVTVAGDAAFFFGSYDDRHQLARWRFGADQVDRIGARSGPLRGLAGGRMLSVGRSGYTVITLAEDAGRD